MTPSYNGYGCHHSGDINLVAALMSQGIPLEANCPVSIIESEHGTYGSYRFGSISDDGTLETETLMGHWSGDQPLTADHGFSQVCDFIRARPRGIQRSDDLLDFAAEYLIPRGHALLGLRRMADVPAYVTSLPEGEAAYVLAYVWNRELLFQLHRQASRQLYREEGAGRDIRRAILDTRLPRWKSTELLARLQG